MKKLNYLIVVDMQNDFLTGPLGNDHCRRTIEPVCELIRKHLKKKADTSGIFLTRDTHGKDYMKTLEGKKLPVKHCICNSEGWMLADEINAIVAGDVVHHLDFLRHDGCTIDVVDKRTFGSFDLLDFLKDDIGSKGQLADTLAKNGANLTFDLCGVCTSICVLANAVLLRAKFPNAIIRIHKDACGDVTEEAHEAALKVLGMQQCDIV